MAAKAQAKIDDNGPSVAETARECLEKAGGDVRKATPLMVERVKASRVLRDALTAPLLSNACYDAISAECRQQRRHVWTPPNYTADGNGARVIALATSLLDFPLPGGKRLAEASRGEVAQAADFYATQAADMSHKGRWLRLVAQSVREDQRVADALDELRLAELQKEAANAV